MLKLGSLQRLSLYFAHNILSLLFVQRLVPCFALPIYVYFMPRTWIYDPHIPTSPMYNDSLHMVRTLMQIPSATFRDLSTFVLLHVEDAGDEVKHQRAT